MEHEAKLNLKRSETFEDYLADDAWAAEGGNVDAGDPAPPEAVTRLSNHDTPQAA